MNSIGFCSFRITEIFIITGILLKAGFHAGCFHMQAKQIRKVARKKHFRLISARNFSWQKLPLKSSQASFPIATEPFLRETSI
jgi:hypothetical protein